jgi:hypothetical protein
MDYYTLAVAIYIACGVVYFALRDQKKHDRAIAETASYALAYGLAADRNVKHFATALTEQRLERGPTCL